MCAENLGTVRGLLYWICFNKSHYSGVCPQRIQSP
jgi:hypothetical protein